MLAKCYLERRNRNASEISKLILEIINKTEDKSMKIKEHILLKYCIKICIKIA